MKAYLNALSYSALLIVIIYTAYSMNMAIIDSQNTIATVTSKMISAENARQAILNHIATGEVKDLQNTYVSLDRKKVIGFKKSNPIYKRTYISKKGKYRVEIYES